MIGPDFGKPYKKKLMIEWKVKTSQSFIDHKSQKPSTVLPGVWQLKRKRDIKSGTIRKYKARINIDSSRMKQGIHCDHFYTPVALWNSIILLLIMTEIHGWHTK